MATTPAASQAEMETEVVTLSDQNKWALLERGRVLVIQRQAEAETMLRRLHELSPQLAGNFQLKGDALAHFKFRMICTTDADAVRTADKSVSSYIAVSYCWQNPSWQAVEAAQPMTEWGVSLPIATKILQLRESKDEGVWVDKICIDQQNDEEKKVTIGSMDTVYRSCRRLVIVMEDIQLNQTQGAAGVKYAELYESMCQTVRKEKLEGLKKMAFIETHWKIEEQDLPQAKAFAMTMLGSRWYTRAWCAHEVRVNEHGRVNNPLILCFGVDGRVLAFEFRYIYWLAGDINRIEIRDNEFGLPAEWQDPSILSDPTCPTFFQRMARMQRLQAQTLDSKISLLSHINTIATFGCQEDTDLCAIAMNTAGVPLVFTGDFRSRNDIHYLSSLISIASGDINPLFIDSQTLKLLDSSGNPFISWAGQPVNGVSKIRFENPFQNSIHRVTAEYIELDLLLIKGRPLKITMQSTRKASAILEKHGLKAKDPRIGVHVDSYTEQLVRLAVDMDTKATAKPNWNEEILACAMDCGLDWMMRFPDVLNKEARQGRWDHGTFHGSNPAFTNAAIDLLSEFGKTRENSPDFEEKFLRPTIRFFTVIMDDRLRLLGKLTRPILTREPADFAITSRTSNRGWFAVPLAIAHLPFFYNRAWIIEPYNPDAPEEESTLSTEQGVTTDLESYTDTFPFLDSDYPDRRRQPDEKRTWKMKRKSVLFGCQPIVADGEAVVILKNQKVYGGEDYEWGKVLKIIADRNSQRTRFLEICRVAAES